MKRTKHAPACGCLSRRDFLATAAVVCSAGAVGATPVTTTQTTERVVIPNVDRFRVKEPNYEGLRIVLRFLGERYSPAYIQGISGGAFRIAGICPCAPNCSTQMGTTDLIKRLGYEYTESILGWADDVEDAKRNMVALIPRIKESIRAGRPVLLWYGFADTAYEVVVGFDDAKGVFLGRHAYQAPNDPPAEAKQTRAEEAAKICPALGAIFLGKKVGKLDARAVEVAALREAVRHAHDAQVVLNRGGTPPRSGLTCYDWWVDKFSRPDAKREAGDSHCHQVYATTHRAAGEFLNEIAPRYPQAADDLRAGAVEFAAEARVLARAKPLIDWQSPELDASRNAKLRPLLAEARDRYAAAIGHIEVALPRLD